MAEERQTYRKKAARASKGQAGSATSKRSTSSRSTTRTKTSSSRSKSRQAGRAPIKGEALGYGVDSLKTRFLSSKVAMVIAAVIAALIVLVLFDTFANYGKAYGNVSVGGKSVAGLTEEEIRSKLQTDYGDKISGAEVRIYASDSAKSRESSEIKKQETAAQAEQVSVEDAKSSVTSWVTSASGVRAQIPYDELVAKALEAGRDGGFLSRLSLFVIPQDIPFDITYDDDAVEKLASAIDATIGDERSDALVTVDEGYATAVKGHDGKMVDREWLKAKLTEALLANESERSFVAEAVEAPSRTTYEQAQEMATNINRALNSNLTFRYHTQSWQVEPSTLGEWTKVDVAKAEDGYELKASIDEAQATSDLVKHLDASVSGENVIVDFEIAGEQVLVKTSGAGIIPEVGPAVARAGEALYGAAGIAWGSGGSAADIDVSESNAPEELTFDQAIDLGIITAVSEYTTEFSDAEGTENRNHNIKVAADLLNNTVCDSNGGIWSFNTHSGDTNQDPPFASAGSIVDGEYVDSIGGGICQVATTVFNAVYEAGLEIDDRHNHSLYIASYPTGRDAAVSYPEMDLVWSNHHTSDVLLKLAYTDTTVTASLYSTPIGYKVSTETGEWEDGEKYKTLFETDETLGEGSYYLKTTGADGSQITIVRTVTDMHGTVVKEDTFTSVYSPKDEVYLVGPGTDTSRIADSHSDSGTIEDEELEEETEEELGYDEESSYDHEESDGGDYEEYDEETYYEEGV